VIGFEGDDVATSIGKEETNDNWLLETCRVLLVAMLFILWTDGFHPGDVETQTPGSSPGVWFIRRTE